jgi:tetratricopeptide (TPR) repeat protein
MLKKLFATGMLLSLSLQYAAAVEQSVMAGLIEQGQYQEALSQIDNALANNYSDISLQALRADALAASGEEDKAIELYQQLIKQYPEQAELYNNLAILLSNQGQFEAARDTLNAGLKTDKTYATIYDNLSNIYRQMARDSYGKALQLGGKPAPLPLRRLSVKSNQPIAVAVTSATSSEPSETSKVNDKADDVVSPAPSAEEVVSAEAAEISSDEQQVIDSLQAWAAAWSAQAVDLYLSFYHRDFKPLRGLKRAAWEAQRRTRLNNPTWIQVQLDDIKIEMTAENHARVTLVQSYKSNGYQDKTRKQILLAQSGNGWRIVKEHSIGIVQ